MNIKTEITNIAKNAQTAARQSLSLSTGLKNKVLMDMAGALIKDQRSIIAANQIDLESAKKQKATAAFIDRLILSSEKIRQMSDSLGQIAGLADPVGECIKSWIRPNGLRIQKVRIPIGVVAIIYESRPNVTSDCLGLCFKSGNSVILRGGSEAFNSNLAIFNTLSRVIKKYHIPQAMVNMVLTKDRKAVNELLKLSDYIDLVMPRGGEELIRKVAEVSRIPVIKHYKGICHTYVDKFADLEMARKVCFNAKVQRPGVCNAMESMLVHQDIAAKFLPAMLGEFHKAGVEIRGCSKTRKIFAKAKAASDKDYSTEYLGLVLSVKVVKDVFAAADHINHYGSHHSDSIITANKQNALRFLNGVDSACVYTNASTRFTDGYQFGMGAEIGISTDKLHARGPMALEELTTYKYMVWGNGQVRQ